MIQRRHRVSPFFSAPFVAGGRVSVDMHLSEAGSEPHHSGHQKAGRIECPQGVKIPQGSK